VPDPAAALASDRVAIARRLIEFGRGDEDLLPAVSPAEAAVRAAASRRLALPWPAGLAPTPTELEGPPDPEAPLPKADYLVVTWTVAELETLADVLTPGFVRRRWYPYSRLFEERYRPQIRGGAPSLGVGRLGSYFATRIGNASVVCVKSELYLNQDGKPTGEGTATLPGRRPLPPADRGGRAAATKVEVERSNS